jgi:hypothetical protein
VRAGTVETGDPPAAALSDPAAAAVFGREEELGEQLDKTSAATSHAKALE